MSNFTTEVRFICEVAAGYDESQDRDKVSEIIDAARPTIFDFDYPIFDETYKPILERKILRHYYTREIAFETVGLWKLKLEARLNEIMPKYNKLYQLELINYNPLWDVDLHEDKERTIDTDTSGSENRVDTGTSESISNGTQTDDGHHDEHSTELYSDTPQGYITDLADGKYLTNATVTNTNGNNYNARGTTDNTTANTSDTRNKATTGTVDTTDEYVKHIKGKRGGLTYSKMLSEEIDLIDKIDNLDYRIIRELKDLFFMLWA